MLGSDGRVTQQGPPKSLVLDSNVGNAPPRKDEPIITGEIAEITAGPLQDTSAATGARAKETPQDRRHGEVAAYFYYFASLGHLKLAFAGACIASFVFFQLFSRKHADSAFVLDVARLTPLQSHGSLGGPHRSTRRDETTWILVGSVRLLRRDGGSFSRRGLLVSPTSTQVKSMLRYADACITG